MRVTRLRSIAGAVLAALLLTSLAAFADPTAAPTSPDFNLPLGAPTLPPSVRLPKLPGSGLHTMFLVETNKKGQVTRVRSGTGSSDNRFNIVTYGNALQTFIRTPAGNAVAGTFRLDYNYSPSTGHVQRDVTLVTAGGVNPNAEGAVYKMMLLASRHAPSPKPTKK
ncbi:MAG TPA: hypothetical protein VGD50_08455 [Candidatus Baltobacteraceae bacterium]